MQQLGQVSPDPDADFELFDRVVNVRTLGVAPYGLKGTIVGVHPGLLLFLSSLDCCLCELKFIV